MKRVALFAVLAVLSFAWLTSGLEAQGKCLNRDTCQPPPCEFLADLLLAKQRLRHFGRQEGASERNFRNFLEELAPALRKVYPEYFSCTAGLPQLELSSSPTCESLDDALRAPSGCSEFTDAMRKQQASCQTEDDPPLTLAERTLAAEQAKIDFLQSSLGGFLSSCAPDAKLSLELAQAGLGLLVQGAEKRRNDWKAGRAGPSPVYDPGWLTLRAGPS